MSNINEYSEESLIELPATELFQSLGYEHLNCFHERFGESSTLAKEASSDVIFPITILCYTPELLLPNLINGEIIVEILDINIGGLIE